jgi:hypothetical protein
MAYGEVNLKPLEAEGEYENPDTILKSSGQGNTYEAIGASNPEYATTEEAVCVTQYSK